MVETAPPKKVRSSARFEDIFGGSSDISELSESEDWPAVRVATRVRNGQGERDRGEITSVIHKAKRNIVPRRPINKSLNSSTSCISSSESFPSIRTAKKRAAPASSESPVKRPKIETLSSAIFTLSSSSRSAINFANIYDTNQVVWVRLDAQGFAVDGNSDLTYWWPGKVISADPLQISVKLIGSDGYGPQRCISVEMPSPCTVLPFQDGGDVPFTTDNFLSMSARSDQSELPQDITSRWLKAYDQAWEMEKEDQFPDALALISSTDFGTKRRQGKAGKTGVQTIPSPRVRPRAMTPLDDNISFGHEDGELVLARDNKNRADHWPARVVSVSQDGRTGRWLYELRYIDETYKKVERSAFFSSEEEGFAICQVGQWETIVPMDDSEPDTDDEFLGWNIRRFRSPSPMSDQVEDIHDLDAFRCSPITEQLGYVYPFLCRIIRGEYGPVLDRHEAFMKGGKSRESLAATAGKGHFSDNEAKKVGIYVRKVMLRDDRWAERVNDSEDSQEPSAQPPSSCVEHRKGGEITPHMLSSQGSVISPPAVRSRRPIGCKEYEAFAATDRNMYCTDVLIPEAIVQLHLFRAGYRKSTKLLSHDEEMELHRRGVALVEENKVHWVLRVMELRKMAENRHNKRYKRLREETILSGGSTSRLRARKG